MMALDQKKQQQRQQQQKHDDVERDKHPKALNERS